MPDLVKQYKIMLSTPGDTDDLRAEAETIIQDWNDDNSDSKNVTLQRLHWKKSVVLTANRPPQRKITDTMVSKADIFVVIFRHRLGTPTGRAISGTVEELDDALNMGKEVLLYFSDEVPPKDWIKNEEARKQVLAVQGYKEHCEKLGRGYYTFDGKDGFGRKFRTHLNKLMNELVDQQPPSSDSPSPTGVSSSTNTKPIPPVVPVPVDTTPVTPPRKPPPIAEPKKEYWRDWPGELRETITLNMRGDTVDLEFVLIPPGTFTMGSPEADKNAREDERPAHQVTISQPFYLGKYPVTQEQWQAVIGSNPSHFKDRFDWQKRPVECVSWNDTQAFIEKLLQIKMSPFVEQLRQQGYDCSLPTEAQWEYACRADSQAIWPWGNDESKLGNYAWYGKNSGGETHVVGGRKANTWGLYDMLGNVWEWVVD